jgi:hypothetical protein
MINKFKCLGRDDIVSLFFPNSKSPISNCNAVLRRLRDRGHIKQSKKHFPSLYLSKENPIKETSQKIPHFLALFNVFRTLKNYLSAFDVEPKIGTKGTVEPDVFMIFNNTPFFVEVQLTQYSNSVMNEKIKRYESYFYSNEWTALPWQPEQPFFPYIVIFSETPYEIDSFLQVIQFKSANDLLLQSAIN